MSIPALLTLFAIAAQVAISIYAVVTLGLARVAHIRSGALKLKDIALSDMLWPDEIKAMQNNLRNQFETPVLFLVGAGLALSLGAANWGVALFAWAFIVSRVVHRMIHVGSNHVIKRFNAFVAGLVALVAMWVALLIDAVV